jgi:hypothetical protein
MKHTVLLVRTTAATAVIITAVAASAAASSTTDDCGVAKTLLLALMPLTLLLLLLQPEHVSCRTLAEKMGGTIGFVDNAPHGTVMTLRIPANLHQLEKLTTNAAASVTASVTDGTCWQRSNSNCSSSSSGDSLDESSCEHLLRTQHILVRY